MDDSLVFLVDEMGERDNLGNLSMAINQHRLMHQPQPQPRPQSSSPSLQSPDAQQQEAPHFALPQQQQMLHQLQASDQNPRQLQAAVAMEHFSPSFFAVSDPYAGSPYASPAGGGPGFASEYQYELGSEMGPDSGVVLAGSVSPFAGAAPLPLAPGPVGDAGHFWGPGEPQPSPLPEGGRSLNAIDEFFIKNGAHRPPVPCNYCRRWRLQCLILQTTSANPNPVSSCSSCVALYRDCSLAERSKREASAYETALPVIGHLHGVCEEVDNATTTFDGTTQWQAGRDIAPTATRSSSIVSYKRNSTRSVKKTRILRNWFATHQEHPYPSEDEKSMLADQSGLSKTQVINWFANARRRHRLTAQSHFNNNSKVFLQGSPMPQTLLGGMSPMERWRHSPPNEEPVSAAVIENAISNHLGGGGGDGYVYTLDGNYATDGAPSSASSESAIYNNHPSARYDASSNSGSSGFSFYQSDDAGIFSLSAQSSIHGGNSGPSAARPIIGLAAERGKAHMFQCTFCLQSFKKKYDWVRHERSIHLPGLDSWICKVPLPEDQPNLVWRVNHSEPECIFCGQTSPTEEHVQSHEFQSCAERPVSERTFTRKDHLWQHLHKFHRCRKWDGWKPNLHLLQHRQDKFESVCGFCQLKMQSWDERVQHLASHFRRGATMAEWTGGNVNINGRDGGSRGMPSNRTRVTPLSGDEADSSSLALFS